MPLTEALGQRSLPVHKQEILLQKNTLSKLAPTALLVPAIGPLTAEQKAASAVEAASYFRINPLEVAALRTKSEGLLHLQLPTAAGTTLDLQLVPARVFSESFEVYLGSDRSQPLDYDRPNFYWGIVNGNTETVAAISVTDNEVAGVISVDGETYNLGRMEGKSADLHILYLADDLKNPPELSCSTDELEENPLGIDKPSNNKSSANADNCVRMYIEVDYDITVGRGGVTQATDYVTAIFNQVAIMYANENINMVLNELVVWDIEDPYTGSSSGDFFNAFTSQHTSNNFNGDLAHLIGYKGNGGVAFRDRLCQDFRVAYSGVYTFFNAVPQYSWTVYVVTHEIGHNLASPHTHACEWNGDNTAIDGCGPEAGYSGCDGPLPSSGGTVMSYCHLVNSVGVDLALGFGPQPGDLIRDRVYNRPCLTPCIDVDNDAAIIGISAPVGLICESVITPTVTLRNDGNSVLTSVTIDYQIDGGAFISTSWTGALDSGASTSVSLNPTTVSALGTHTIIAITVNPNGVPDEGYGSDSFSESFNRQAVQTYYRDADGDGFGNPSNIATNCGALTGYVINNTDCNDNDGNAYPGAPCIADACNIGETLDANCNCGGGSPSGDSDNDGVCDGLDVCNGGDDNVDSDLDGVPDFCDCNAATTNFSSSSLSHSGSGVSSILLSFPSGSKDPSFTIGGMNAQLSGKPGNRYQEIVTVTYVDGSGNNLAYGTFDGATQSSTNIDISGFVQSVMVSLSDGYDGNVSGTISVGLGTVNFCGPFTNCSDSDNDGVCDNADVCPGFNDQLIGQTCDDGDACTANDVWGTDCGCAGTIIPNCGSCTAVTSSFSTSSLTHSGGGSSNANLSFGGTHTDVQFTISGLNARTGGKPSNRFEEIVTVTYVNGNGNTITYGTFSGANQSNVSVSIAGQVQSILVSLSNGRSTNVGLSVSLSSVSSCSPASALTQGVSQRTSAALFPNPTSGMTTLRLGAYTGATVVVVRNTLGAVVQRFQLEGAPTLVLDTQSWAGSQVYLVTVYRGKEHPPVTKRLVVRR